jgi:8-amino-7-oxononanoate synthase
LEVLDRDPNAGARLLKRAARFRTLLQEEGLDTGASASQIIPVHIGENEAALRIAERLREEGILAVAIRPPTVPPGTARLRLSVTLAHDDQRLEDAAKIIARMVREEQ